MPPSDALFPTFSLLRLPGQPPPAAGTRPGLDAADLGLAPIFQALDFDGRHQRFVAGVITELNTDPAVIAYRQAILEDLLERPALYDSLSSLLPSLVELSSLARGRGWNDSSPLHQVAVRLSELQLYMNCLEGLAAALLTAHPPLVAAGWTGLMSWLDAARQEAEYRRLAAAVPELRAQLSQASSITLGLNLNADLQPESVTILALNDKRFTARGSLLGRLLGDQAAEGLRGLGPLYRAEEGRVHLPEHELFREMNRLLEKIARPVAEALARFTRVSSAGLAGLEPELAFYLGAVKLVKSLKEAGTATTLCRAEIAPAAEQAGQLLGMYSLDLVLRQRGSPPGPGRAEVVPNDVAFGPAATIFILTGPNSGGKTTYTRAIGQAQALFQAGLPVPARQARLSPVDAIFTHFAAAERVESGSGGRLEEELERLGHLFRTATPDSLILLNEPLASTDHASARALSRDLLAGLRLLGARAVYVTHIYELVEDSRGLDGTGAAVVNLVAGIRPDGAEPGRTGHAPTYTISPGQPHPLGYAAELARRHGLNLDQISQALRDRHHPT